MDPQLTEELIALTRKAGDAILQIYRTDFEVTLKTDASPLTQADLAAHRIIEEGLQKLTPEIPLLSEESQPPAYSIRQTWPRYWLVDPLDGTREFVNKNGEFTVNIALIENHEPTFGVVGVPVQSLVYTGDIERGALRHDADGSVRLTGRTMAQRNAVVVVASRSHGGDRLENYIESLGECFGTVSRTPVGSSLKLCILAEGAADLYPRLGPTSEWDIAAAHAVLSAAGGALWAVDGSRLEYNRKESFLNPEFFAVADGAFAWKQALPAVPAQAD